MKESMHGRIVALQDLDKKYAWASSSQNVNLTGFYTSPGGTKEGYGGYYYSMNYLPIDGDSKYYYSGRYTDFHLPYNYYTWPTEQGERFAITD